jgi:apolipoprotein N-acyltransferase
MVDRLTAIAQGIAVLTGWRRALLAGSMGGLAAFALPPFYVLPLLIPAFVVLIWLIDGAHRLRTAYWTGFWFGLGHFVIGLYWIANAMLVDAARFWWMIPFSLLGLPAVISLIYIGPVAALTWRFGGRGSSRVLLFAGLWTVAELVRGVLFTGFPWNMIGYCWNEVGPIRQAAAWVGVYGVSLLTVLAAAAPAILSSGERGVSIKLITLYAALAIIGLCGWIRLADDNDAMIPDVTLRLVQPNIAQSLKWDGQAAAANFENLLALSAEPSKQPLTAILWPESATSYYLEREPAALEAIHDHVNGAMLITGSLRATRSDDGHVDYWNGMIALDGAGKLVGTYDKFHLVPFGEYVPLRHVLPIGKLTPGANDFSRGPGPRTVTVAGLPPFGPLICFEVIFPGEVIDKANRPKWLLTLTNDGWYGYSTGPFQHFVQAGWRAIEEGMPLVRVANTGISGVVDPYGRVVAELGLEERGYLDVSLPKALPTPPLYARYGDGPVWVLSLIMMIGGIWIRFKEKFSN